MARFPRLDPEYERGVALSTKLAPPDADRIRRLAEQDGMNRSEYLRTLLLDVLSRAEPEPPGERAA